MKLVYILAMVIFGTIGLFRRLVPYSSEFISVLRGLIGGLSLLVCMLLLRKKPDFKSVKKQILPLLLSGVFLGVNWLFLFESYEYTTVAKATLCYYMAPIFVILLSPVVFHERFTAKKLVCIFMSFLGMLFVSGYLGFDSGVGFTVGISNAGNDAKGIVYGLLAAVCYAGLIIMNKRIKDVPAFEKTLVQLVTGAIVMIPVTLIKTDFSAMEFTAKSIIFLLIICVVHTGIAFTLFFGSMTKLDSQTVAFFGYLDPVIAIMVSAIFLREGFGLAQALGTIFVLGAAVLGDIKIAKK